MVEKFNPEQAFDYIKEGMDSIARENKAGFKEIHTRLDTMNGRVSKNTTNITVIMKVGSVIAFLIMTGIGIVAALK